MGTNGSRLIFMDNETTIHLPSSELRNVLRRGVLKFSCNLAIVSVVVKENTTIHSPDVLERHFKCIPLNQNSVVDGDVLVLRVSNHKKAARHLVTGRDLNGCHDDQLLLILKPGDCIHVEMTVGVGCGDSHASFVPPVRMAFRGETDLHVVTEGHLSATQLLERAKKALQAYIKTLIPADSESGHLHFEPGGIAPAPDRGVCHVIVREMNQRGYMCTHTFAHNAPVFDIYGKNVDLATGFSVARKALIEDISKLELDSGS